MRNTCRSGLVAAVVVGAATAPSLGFDLEMDPGLGWGTFGGVGEGRSVYFTANETFTIQGAGFMANMDAGTYEVVIFAGEGEQAPAGPMLHSVQVPLGGVAMDWQDAALSFEFVEGLDYILHFRHSVPGMAVASQYQRASTFWGNSPSEFLNLGVVTIRNGRAGYLSQSANNAAFPRMRLLGITVGAGCYADCDGNEALNIDDFLCFINEFSQAQLLPPSQQMSHYANCDGSTNEPILTIDDFLCFINEFAQGCP